MTPLCYLKISDAKNSPLPNSGATRRLNLAELVYRFCLAYFNPARCSRKNQNGNTKQSSR